MMDTCLTNTGTGIRVCGNYNKERGMKLKQIRHQELLRISDSINVSIDALKMEPDSATLAVNLRWINLELLRAKESVVALLAIENEEHEEEQPQPKQRKRSRSRSRSKSPERDNEERCIYFKFSQQTQLDDMKKWRDIIWQYAKDFGHILHVWKPWIVRGNEIHGRVRFSSESAVQKCYASRDLLLEKHGGILYLAN